MRVLLMVVVAASTACAASGARPLPFPQPGRQPPVPDAIARPAGSVPASGYEISGTALALRGAPYRNGGADPTGFDCSGLVAYVFARHGLSVPRTVEDLFSAGANVAPGELRAGDLVFFSITGSGATHVGIVIGGDSFVHAPSSQGVVRVERLGAAYWASRFVGARRVF